MSQPNILFIFADQLRYSALGCYGNEVVQTPNLDALARDGVVFDNAFSSCPLCSPYRGQLLTGRYSHANGVMCNEYALFDDQTTIADALAETGYRLTDTQADELKRVSPRSGVTTLWFYAPGYLSPEGVTPDRVADLTGLRLSEATSVAELQCKGSVTWILEARRP